MNRIDHIFENLRRDKRKGLMPFVTAGDPDLDTTAALLGAIERAGASVCELGIPFTDPIADGPMIQASMTHALGQGVRPADILEMVAAARSKLSIGLVVMVSYSIVQRLGEASFIQDAAAAGIDGFIFPDLTLEEYVASDVRGAVADAGLICSLLVSPTTPDERARQIAEASSGFVYVMSRAGITGEQECLPQDLTHRIEQLRGATSLPIAVGFGISSAQQVRQVVQAADAAIVGSTIMRRIAQCRGDGSDAVVEQVGRYVSQLAVGLSANGELK